MTDYQGGIGNDNFVGTTSADKFYLSDGGDDTAKGGLGSDSFYMGAALNAADRIDGGTGPSEFDTVFLDGDYSAGLVLTAATVRNIETFSFQPGFNYELQLVDGNVLAGGFLTFDATLVGAGHHIRVDDHKETDADIGFAGGAGVAVFKAGAGADNFLLNGGGRYVASGGAGDDHFYMGASLIAADRINGGDGTDYLTLDGDYASGLKLANATLTSLEQISFSAGHDYKIKTADGNVAAGQVFGVSQLGMGSGDRLIFDGSHERDGHFSFYDGAGDDHLIGGDQTDYFSMEVGGRDTLTGGAGDDIFYFAHVTDSPAATPDLITDFSAGDTLNLSPMDADTGTPGDQAFTLVSHFTNVAGQATMHYAAGHNLTTLAMDVNGDGVADAAITFTGNVVGVGALVL